MLDDLVAQALEQAQTAVGLDVAEGDLPGDEVRRFHRGVLLLERLLGLRHVLGDLFDVGVANGFRIAALAVAHRLPDHVDVRRLRAEQAIAQPQQAKAAVFAHPPGERRRGEQVLRRLGERGSHGTVRLLIPHLERGPGGHQIEDVADLDVVEPGLREQASGHTGSLALALRRLGRRSRRLGGGGFRGPALGVPLGLGVGRAGHDAEQRRGQEQRQPPPLGPPVPAVRLSPRPTRRRFFARRCGVAGQRTGFTRFIRFMRLGHVGCVVRGRVRLHDPAIDRRARVIVIPRGVRPACGWAVVHHPAFGEAYHRVGLVDDVFVVGNHECGLSSCEFADRGDDPPLGRGVERRGGLIEDEDFRVLENGPGEGQPLALAAGELHAVAAEQRVVAVGQALDELVGPGFPSGFADLLVGGVGAGVAEVLHHGGVEEEAFLERDADGAAEVIHVVLGHVDAVDADVAGGGVVEAGEQVDQRALAAARGAVDRAEAARGHVEGDPAEHRGLLAVGKADVLEGDASRIGNVGAVRSALRRRACRAGRRRDRAGRRLGELGEAGHELEDLGVEHHDPSEEGDELARLHVAPDHAGGAEADEQDGAESHQHVGDDLLPDVEAVRAELPLPGEVDRGGEALALALLAAEALDDLDAEELFDEVAVDLADLLLRFFARAFDGIAEEACGDEVEREHDRRREREQAVLPEQRRDQAQHHQHRLEQLGQLVLNKRLDHEAVVHDAAGDLAGAGLLVVPHAELLQPLEQALAELERDVLADLHGRVLALEKQQVPPDVHRPEPREHAPQHHPHPADEHLVDQHAHQPRTRDVDARQQEHHPQHQQQPGGVRLEQRTQSPHHRRRVGRAWQSFALVTGSHQGVHTLARGRCPLPRRLGTFHSHRVPASIGIGSILLEGSLVSPTLPAASIAAASIGVTEPASAACPTTAPAGCRLRPARPPAFARATDRLPARGSASPRRAIHNAPLAMRYRVRTADPTIGRSSAAPRRSPAGTRRTLSPTPACDSRNAPR